MNISVLKEKHSGYGKEIDEIMKNKSTDTRARAAYKLWLKINPMCSVSFEDGERGWLPAKRVHNLTIEKVKYLRSMSNKYATNESGSMRYRMEFPPGSLEFLQAFHPDLFLGTRDDQKLRFSKLRKAFPEFNVAQEAK